MRSEQCCLTVARFDGRDGFLGLLLIEEECALCVPRCDHQGNCYRPAAQAARSEHVVNELLTPAEIER